jgi:hypothetical protein
MAKIFLLLLRIRRTFAVFCRISVQASDGLVYPVTGGVELAVNARETFAIIRDGFGNLDNRVLEI